MNTLKIASLLGLLGLAACNGNGEFLRSVLGKPDVGVTGFNTGKVGADGTPVKRTPYGAQPAPVQAGENYQKHPENLWIEAAAETTSTFGVDVDNGSYTLMRDDIQAGRLPHPDGVRPEEYINFFDYGYAEPEGDAAFAVDMELGPSPFGDEAQMLKIGLQAKTIDPSEMKPNNLVFLIDTSGSMGDANKLALVQQSLHILLDNLRPSDTVGIVTYAGHAGVLLPPTPVSKEAQIRLRIDQLRSGGSTNGHGGIVKAYELAERFNAPGGNNRVVLATDGDFNVGLTGEPLLKLIADNRKRGITITTVGYGRGNFNDAIMEGISREGNGNYFYIDQLKEAERVFGEELSSTLQVVASDVKIQVKFDPSIVYRYRLIGYENRVMANKDFDDDTKDAGEIGQGHTVTALYEVELVGSCGTAVEEVVEEVPIEELPTEEVPSSDVPVEEPWEEVGEPDDCVDVVAEGVTPDTPLATVRLRHKEAIGLPSRLQSASVAQSDLRRDLLETTAGFQFAVAVAAYAETLRAANEDGRGNFDDILAVASAAQGNDPVKAEFVELVRQAKPLYRGR